MFTVDNITEIYCKIDDFYKEFEQSMKGISLEEDSIKEAKKRVFLLSDSKLTLFHLGNYRNLKHFYLFYVQKHLTAEFPKTVAYNRFVELQKKALLPMIIFLKMKSLGECTGISFIYSTKLPVCNKRRIHNHHVFKDIATRGYASTGYFYGFKLHLTVNDRGEILNFVITQANVDDREPLKNESFIQKIKGKLVGDKGYISKELFKLLFTDDIQLITKLKKNMKGKILSNTDSVLLRKKAVIESINDELKNICQIEHTRHRSFHNFIGNIISGLIAYSFLPKKPSIKVNFNFDDKQLTLF